MVEFAVILPVFLGLIAGIFGLGLAMRTKLELSTAAQEGARAAYLGRSTTEVRDAVIAAAAFNTPLTAAEVTAHPTCTTSGSTVTVTAEREVELNLILWSATRPIQGRGVVRCP